MTTQGSSSYRSGRKKPRKGQRANTHSRGYRVPVKVLVTAGTQTQVIEAITGLKPRPRGFYGIYGMRRYTDDAEKLSGIRFSVELAWGWKSRQPVEQFALMVGELDGVHDVHIGNLQKPNA